MDKRKKIFVYIYILPDYAKKSINQCRSSFLISPLLATILTAPNPGTKLEAAAAKLGGMPPHSPCN
jgi:hypothetical protein